jgi:hypothetical protein
LIQVEGGAKFIKHFKGAAQGVSGNPWTGMKRVVIWDVALSTLVDIDRRVVGACCVSIALMNSFEMPINVYQTTWRTIPEVSYIL